MYVLERYDFYFDSTVLSRRTDKYPIGIFLKVPGKLHGCGGYSSRNCLQDLVNFQKSWALQIVIIVNTAITMFNLFIMILQIRFRPTGWEKIWLSN